MGRNILQILAVISFIAAVGHSLGHLMFDEPFPVRLAAQLIVLCFIPVGSGWIHELAHVVAARVLRLPVAVVVLSPLIARRQADGWSYSHAVLARNLTVFSVTDVSPEHYARTRGRAALAGSAANIGIAMVALLAIGLMALEAALDGRHVFAAYGSLPTLLLFGLVWNVAVAWLTLTPDPNSNDLEDGEIRRELREPGGQAVVQMHDRVNALAHGDRRPRAWTLTDVEFLTAGLMTPTGRPADADLRLKCGLLLALADLDHARHEDALAVLESIHATWAETPSAVGTAYGYSLAIAALLWMLRDGVSIPAREALAALPVRSAVGLTSFSRMARALILLSDGETRRAGAEIATVIATAKGRLPWLAEAVVELDLAEGIAGTIDLQKRGAGATA